MPPIANPMRSAPAVAASPAVRNASVVSPAPVLSIRDPKTHCMTCNVRERCLPVGFAAADMKQFDALIVNRTKLKKQQTLYRAGETFHALYAIRVGSLKTTLVSEDGREQVTGYHMQGDLIGFDGIGTDRHGAAAIALEDAEVCTLPFTSIEDLARTTPALQHVLHQVMSREIARDQSVMLLLASMRAEERLAAFLLNLGERYHRRGYAATEYELRMRRWEIGSYLGLTLETVSRLFSQFQKGGLIQVQGRAVKLLDPVGLKQIVGQRG
jgi:CRP/FNR family transcriptional regulator